MSAFDLDAYLARIGWQGSLEPTLDTLAGLTRAHITRIPFENVDVLLGRGIRIDLDSIVAKMVVAGRGGYCFEHGTLFQAVLEAVGFRPVAHAARVVVMVPRHQSPRTHMFLTVDIEGERFMVDPGFGGHTTLLPVPLRDGAEVRDGSDRHRMVRHEGEWVLEAEIDGTMTALWTATLEPQLPIDFQLANHWVSTAAASPFVNRLMLRALTPGGRTSVMNRDVTVIERGEDREISVGRSQGAACAPRRAFRFRFARCRAVEGADAVPEWSIDMARRSS